VLVPALIAVTLVLGGMVVLTGAYVMTSRARLAVDQRVNLVARTAAIASRDESGISSLQAALSELDRRIRAIFAVGVAYTWGMKSGSLTLVLVAILSAAGTWFLVGRTFGFSALITVPTCMLVAFLVPRNILLVQQRGADRAFTNVFPDAVDSVARMLRAGLPATLAIRTVGNDAAPPVNAEFANIADQMRIGVPLSEAIEASSLRIGLADFRFFSVAVALQHSTGGNLVNTLDILSQIMRKRRAVRMKAKAVTSEIRLSAYVLGALPFVTSAAILVIQPNYLTPLFNDPRGQMILAIAVGGLVLSVWAMRLMMKSVSSE
jgi:tight adherence protein B